MLSLAPGDEALILEARMTGLGKAGRATKVSRMGLLTYAGCFHRLVSNQA